MRHKNVAIFTLVFAVIGSLALLATHAAVPTVSIELETANITAPAIACTTDNTASNNGCVQFKKAACTGITITAGSSIQSAINANPTSTTFCLNGTFNLTSPLLPKNGDSFIGPATIDGGNTATLAIDGNNVDNVTVKELLIQHFNNADQLSALGKNNEGTGWDIENNEVAFNTTEGIFAGDGAKVKNNHSHDNGQLGISGYLSSNAIIDNNEVDHNGATQYLSIEGGGMKFARGTNVTISNNKVHDNIGTGIWLDTDVVNSLVTANTITNNTAADGINIEITCNVTVSNNTIVGASTQVQAIMLSSSHDITVTGNTTSGGTHGIRLWMDNTRSTQTICGAPSINNDHITANTITLATGTSHTSGVFIYNGGTDTGTTPTGVIFSGNIYHASDCSTGHWQWYASSNLNYSFTNWQGLPQDTSGSCGL